MLDQSCTLFTLCASIIMAWIVNHDIPNSGMNPVTTSLLSSQGMMGAAIFLVGMSFMDCSQTGLAVALLTVSVTISGTCYTGFLVNHIDIAPPYAGTLMGVANGLAGLSGIIGPIVAAAITQNVRMAIVIKGDHSKSYIYFIEIFMSGFR